MFVYEYSKGGEHACQTTACYHYSCDHISKLRLQLAESITIVSI